MTGFDLRRPSQKARKGVVIAQLKIEPVRPLATVREVDIEEPEVLVFAADEPPLLVEFRYAEPVYDRKGLYFAVEGDPAIPLS
jgi:hypothetical protein